MWILKRLLSMCIYPIMWFWKEYEKYKVKNNVFMVILLWVVSLTGVGVIGYAIYRLLEWMVLYHMDMVIIGCLIAWLYSYVKSKLTVNVPMQSSGVSADMQALIDQANRAYPTVRNIMYQTLKESAESIGGVIPRVLQEIEVLEKHYIISNNIVFYQFRLSKSDIKIRYDMNELEEFERILQNEISRKIQAGAFPTLGMEPLMDAYGNLYDAVHIDVIEDVDNCFIIQTVMYSPQYAEYLRQKRMNRQNMLSDTSIPEANWDR